MADDNEPIGMIELDQNLADVEKPPILPAARYVGEVQDVQKATSQAGNEYFAIKIVVPTDQIRADMAEQFDDGAILYWNRQVVPNGKDRRALWNMRKLLEALDMDTKTNTIDPNDWMGKQIGILVGHSTFQGEVRAEIKSVFPANTSGGQQQQREEAKAPAKASTPARGASAGRARR